MSKTEAWQLFAVMDGRILKRVIAQSPDRRETLDVTADLRVLMHPLQAMIEAMTSNEDSQS